MAALDLNALQELLTNAERSAANEKEIRKALTRIENLQSNITQEIQHVYQLMDGSAEPKARKTRTPRAEAGEVDAEAPYGRKKDGTPKAKPGRGQAAGEAAAE
jgi:hypothetical protein